MPIMNLGESQEKKIADLFSEHNVKIVNVATTDKIRYPITGASNNFVYF